jgi:hypothetical protein
MWEPRRLTTLWAFTACYRGTFLRRACDAVYSGRNLPTFRRCVMKVGSTFPAVNGMGLMVTTSKKNIQCIQEQVIYLLPLFALCLLHTRYLLLQSIISWTMVLSHHITRYPHALTHIHILPQNSRHWPLCESANVGISPSIRSPQILMRSSGWTRGTLCWVTRGMFTSPDRIMWQVPWLIPAAAADAISSTVWQRSARTNVATSWILSSVLTDLGRPVCSSSSKPSLPCECCRSCLHGRFYSLARIHGKCLLSQIRAYRTAC